MSRLVHKPGVEFAVIAEGGAVILKALARQARLSSWDWVISCGTEGHPETDPHTRGCAYDVSLANFPNSQSIARAHAALRLELGATFTVLFETPYPTIDPDLAPIAYLNADATARHFHIQVKRGLSYPPAEEGPLSA